LLGSAAVAWPAAVHAQQPGKVCRIGYSGRQCARVFGAHRSFPARASRPGLRGGSEHHVRLKVDVIIVPSSIYTEAAKRATSTIPIVFMGHADPMATGHVISLARPGGNITGLSVMMTETSVKSLELFKQACVAVIFDPATPSHGPALKAVSAAGPALGLQVQPAAVRSARSQPKLQRQRSPLYS
jgi:putative tryptophan/tyrosine transport system substrate-binding protein